jgi:cell division protein FtsB
MGRRGADVVHADQDAIIASLRKELATQKAQATDAKRLRSQLATQTAENECLLGENKTLKTSAASLQNEIKALQVKLAASRAQAESSQGGKGSSMKQNGASAGAGSAKIDGTALANLKLDLYCDMTGLIIHSVKRVEPETIYDCSQTGRNGSEFR